MTVRLSRLISSLRIGPNVNPKGNEAGLLIGFAIEAVQFRTASIANTGLV
jgi:hypothetical protein